jgi:hypothetical protein
LPNGKEVRVRKLSRLVAVVALLAMVGSTAALAYGPVLSYAQRYNQVKNMKIYDRNWLLRPDEGANLVQMPTGIQESQAPTIAEMMQMRDEITQIQGSPADASKLGASVLPGKGGMAMLSPRERTEQEVRRLARSLD